MVKLGNVAKVRNGYAFASADFGDSGVPVIRMSDLKEFYVETSNAARVSRKYWDELNLFRVVKGDLIIGMSGSVGKTAIYNSDEPALQNQRVGVFQIKDTTRLDADYLKYFAFTLEDRLLALSRGVAVKNISATEIESFEIPLPPLDEQKRIAAILEEADHARRTRRFTQSLSDTFLQEVFVEMFGDPVTNPMGWEVVRLGKLLSTKPRIGTTQPAKNEGKHLCVRVGEIGMHRHVELENSKYVTLSDDELGRFSLKPDDILLARAIGSIEHLGKFSIMQSTNKSVVYDSHVMRLRLDQDLMDVEFFSQFLMTRGGRMRFMQQARQTSVQFNVNAEQIQAVEIPLPPRKLQDKFADIVLDHVDNRQQQHESLRQAEHLFQTLLHQAFRGEL